MRDTTSLPEMCGKLGEVLGMDKPVPMQVLLRAVDDPVFANDLITSRGAPGFLSALFDDRRTRAYTSAVEENQATSLALAGKAASALMRWGKAGFSTVDEAVLERRETACVNCPNLADPKNVLQKLLPSAETANKPGSRLGGSICSLCGCIAGKKIRLPTESCPDAHPVASGVTRWSEPLPSKMYEAVA